MLEKLVEYAGAIGGTALLSAGAIWAIKKYAIPGYAKAVGRVLTKALHPDNPDPELNERIKDLALASVRLAEYCIPDRGKGIERFALVDGYLAKLHIPADIRKMLIEEAVWTMDDELKKAANPPA